MPLAAAGLMHPVLGGYGPGDIEISAAFDIDSTKVGKDVATAIFAPPNNTMRFADVPRTGVRVQRGPTLDGLGVQGAGPHTLDEHVLVSSLVPRAKLLAGLLMQIDG